MWTVNFHIFKLNLEKAEESEKWSCSVMSDSLRPHELTVAYHAPLSTGFSRKGAGVGCHFLLQRIFLTQGSNPGLLHCRQLYHLSHQGSLPDIKLATSIGSSKMQKSSRKTSTSALLTMPKPLTVWFPADCGKFWKRWEYQTTWPASWEICMQVRKQQLELDMEQQTGSQSWKEYVKAVYCHPAF